jgi:hypothetical protein
MGNEFITDYCIGCSRGEFCCGRWQLWKTISHKEERGGSNNLRRTMSAVKTRMTIT